MAGSPSTLRQGSRYILSGQSSRPEQQNIRSEADSMLSNLSKPSGVRKTKHRSKTILHSGNTVQQAKQLAFVSHALHCTKSPAEAEEVATNPVFPLMRLPTELRLHIYRYALVRPFPVLLHKDPPPLRSNGLEVVHDDNKGYNDRQRPVLDDNEDDDDDDHDNDHDHGGNGRRRRMDRSDTAAQDIEDIEPDHGSHYNLRPLRNRRPNRHFLVTSVEAAGTTRSASTGRAVDRLQPLLKREPRPQDDDPLVPALLRVSKTVYKEARQVMYAENIFDMRLASAIPTMNSLHQRSRSMIRDVRLAVPFASDLLDEFAEIVRLSLRYCWGLKTFTIILHFKLTNDSDGGSIPSSLSTMHMYANAFNILRWLPKHAEVVVEGDICDEVRDTITQNATIAKALDDRAYAKRQHQISDASRKE